MTHDPLRGLDPKKLLAGALAGSSPADQEEEQRVRKEIARALPEVEVVSLLGRGGMGYVFEVRHKKLGRRAALKVLAPRFLAEAGLAERFEREAQALAKLSHANIVAVYDFGRSGELCWLLMEMVEGTNLRRLLDGDELTPALALSIVPPLCDALQYAHDRGVVHRDVKPENILIDRKGSVKIADFGLAKLVGEEVALVALTGSQQVLGTLRYMAPEQLDRPLEVDHRADIYSLGVVFYEMLTGEIPMGRFEPPSARSKSDPRLDQVVLRSLEREPARRYQHASDVKVDVESLDRRAGAEPGAARPRLCRHALLSPLLLAAAVPFAALLVHFDLERQGRRALVVVQLEQQIDSLQERLLTTPEFLATQLPTAGAENPAWRSLNEERERLFGKHSRELLGAKIDRTRERERLLLLSLVASIAACWTGWDALRRIRAAWPTLHGVGSAMVGAWFLPVASGTAVSAAILVVSLRAAGIELGEPALLLVLAGHLAVATIFLLGWRVRFLAACEARQGHV